MGDLWDKVCQLAAQPNGLLVASLFANVVLAWALVVMWRRLQALTDRIWEVLKLIAPLAMRRPA
ncbi:MAG: hypothetical protein ABIK12_08605 [Pseudomonadota bacterium]